MRPRQAIALTIAGSDSGGGAGIQADLKVFSALGVHGTSVVTAVTAQNPTEVRSVHLMPSKTVADQMEAVWSVLPPGAVKTGMLGNSHIIKAIAAKFRRLGPVPLVIDPVMISTSGKKLLGPAAMEVLKSDLFSMAALITPNKGEAENLLGNSIETVEDLRSAAREFWKRFGVPVVMKGGHVPHKRLAIDVFWDGRHELLLEAPFVPGLKTHGTGCTFSSAVTSFLAQGLSLSHAVRGGKVYTTAAIQNSVRIGKFTALGIGVMPGG